MTDTDTPNTSDGPSADALAASIFRSESAPVKRVGARDEQAGSASTSFARIQLELDTDRPPPPIPNGWYSICRSDELSSGDVKSVIAVARDLIVFRDEFGAAHVTDAHCPHLGAHLGGGLVVGDSIKCPYHGWRYGPDGACVDVPYHDGRIPAKACLRTFPVIEYHGFVMFWFHANGADPSFELPTVDVLDEPGWLPQHVWTSELRGALQEMGENNVDYAHLRYVHRRPVVPDQTSVFTTAGPFSRVVEQLPDGTDFHRDAFGPGVAVLHVPNVMVVLTTTTPIDRQHCRLLWSFHIGTAYESMVDQLLDGVTGSYGLQADVPIWRDKVFIERPPLVKSDGNIAEFRAWYSQFYS